MTAVPPPIRLLIVDDHPVVRDGLRGMFSGDPGFEVVGEASDGAEAIELAARLIPDVILMDLRMPGVNGAAAIRALAERQIPSRVLVLTTYDSDSDVVPAIEAGATGYLLKDSPRQELFRAVRAAAQGESVLASSVANKLMSQMRGGPAPEALSERELEVLRLIAQGETNRGAAARLFISEATVKTHLLHIYAKLNVNDRAAAVATAFERGLLPTGRERLTRPDPTRAAGAGSRRSSSRCTGRGRGPTCRGRRSRTACSRRTASSCRPRSRR